MTTKTGKISMAIDDAWVFLKFKSQEEIDAAQERVRNWESSQQMYRDLPMEAWDSGTPAGAARYDDMAEGEARRNPLTPDDLKRLRQRATGRRIGTGPGGSVTPEDLIAASKAREAAAGARQVAVQARQSAARARQAAARGRQAAARGRQSAARGRQAAARARFAAARAREPAMDLQNRNPMPHHLTDALETNDKDILDAVIDHFRPHAADMVEPSLVDKHPSRHKGKPFGRHRV